MAIEQRRHIRFSLDIPAIRYTRYGEAQETMISQVSIGGCLAGWDENVYVGDEFRLLVQLPNKNFLPLICKALYKFAENGIGTKFLDITQFEQELLASVIRQSLKDEGLPMQVDPFTSPQKITLENPPRINSIRRQTDDILESILSGGKFPS